MSTQYQPKDGHGQPHENQGWLPSGSEDTLVEFTDGHGKSIESMPPLYPPKDGQVWSPQNRPEKDSQAKIPSKKIQKVL